MKQDLNKRQIRDWPVVGELLFIQCRFLKQWRDDRFRESGMKLARSEGEVDNVVSFCGQPHYCNHPNTIVTTLMSNSQVLISLVIRGI